MGLMDVIRKWLGVNVNKDARKVSTVYTSPYKKDWVQYRGGDYTETDISTVNACLQIRAEAFASGEPRLYNPDGEVVKDHPLLDSLLSGNDLMTWDEILKLTSHYIALTGACYWYIDWGRGMYPRGYYPLAGGKFMSFKLDEKGNYGIFEYNNNGQRVTYQAKDILVFRNVSSNPKTPLQGRPLVEGADYAIQELIGFHNTRMSTLENGSRPDHVYSTEERVPPEEAKKFLEMADSILRGTKNSGKSFMLPYGLTIQDFGSNLDQLMYVEPMSDVKKEILEVLRVPPAMLGTVGEYNKSNIDAATAVFINQTIKPFAKPIAHGITRKLVHDKLLMKGWRFDLHYTVPKDEELFAKTINTNVMSGVMLPNEGRGLMGLPPVKGGEYQFVPVNVARVDTSSGKMVDQPVQESQSGKATAAVKELMYTIRSSWGTVTPKLLNTNLADVLSKYYPPESDAYNVALSEIIDITNKAVEDDRKADWINDKIKKRVLEALKRGIINEHEIE